MITFRVVRDFGPKDEQETKTHRVETSECLTQKEALALMQRLNEQEARP